MKLSAKIDLFTGVISSGNTPALGPVAEELKLPRSSSTAAPTSSSIRRCRSRTTSSASPISSRPTASPCAWRSAHDVAGGAQDRPHPSRLLLRSQRLRSFQHRHEEAVAAHAKWCPKAGPSSARTDFTSHITKAISAKPDLLVSSVWGGDYVAMYKQALRLRLVRQDEVRQHDRLRRRAARHRQGSSRRRHRVACTPTTTSTIRPEIAGP